jgi:hypothetical protein
MIVQRLSFHEEFFLLWGLGLRVKNQLTTTDRFTCQVLERQPRGEKNSGKTVQSGGTLHQAGPTGVSFILKHTLTDRVENDRLFFAKM